ncbi:hypothetical protein V5E97_07275 [Singulisphaera sp. Ch08]|uniref:Uncharacterized protein n=1 Tax=Singulisphaera sp. Ch08 TaxID=3120278 RepID=A0AAU7CLK5_9BACT
MKKSFSEQWYRHRPHHALGLLAIAGALGGITLLFQPGPARRVAIVGGPRPVAVQSPLRPNAPILSVPEDLRPTDRCVIEAPQVDDRFVFRAPQVDDQFVVAPLVRGLRVPARVSK